MVCWITWISSIDIFPTYVFFLVNFCSTYALFDLLYFHVLRAAATVLYFPVVASLSLVFVLSMCCRIFDLLYVHVLSF